MWKLIRAQVSSAWPRIGEGPSASIVIAGWFRFRDPAQRLNVPSFHLILSPPPPLWSEWGQGMGTDIDRSRFPTSRARRIPAGPAQWEARAGGWGASGSERREWLSSLLLQVGLHQQLHIFRDSSWTPNSGLLLVTSAFGLWRHAPSGSQPCWQLHALAKVWEASAVSFSVLLSHCIKHLRVDRTRVISFSFWTLRSIILVLFLKRKVKKFFL